MAPKNLWHHRGSIRLKGYDYSQPGAYFVTACVQGDAFVLGDVANGVIRLNTAGIIVQECWEWLEQQYGHVRLDEYVVMPNHLHGIIILAGPAGALDDGWGGSRTAPTSEIPRIRPKPLGRPIGAFKTVSTKRLNRLWDSAGERIWQRGFFERVIRDKHALGRIREYISSNPVRWDMDNENPGETEMDSFDYWLMSYDRESLPGRTSWPGYRTT